jgi:hypothetical protein
VTNKMIYTCPMHPEIDFHKESAAMAPKRREESTLSKLATKL